MKTKTILLACFFAVMVTFSAYAAIDITERTGTIKIFMPDGKQVVVAKDEPLPTIPDGATITILDGSAIVSTTGKSTVTVSIGTYNVQLREASIINLVLNKDRTVGATIILGSADVMRKAETYKDPIVPATQLENIINAENGGDISNNR